MNEVMVTASEEGFAFSKVTFSDVVLAVAHFSSQAKGEDGILQGMIVKPLTVIGYHLADIFNASLLKEIFPEGQDSFWSQGTRLWNLIPRDIKNVSLASKLETAFRKYLMQRSCDVDCIYVNRI